MIEDTKENSMKCICKECPSKNECMNEKGEWFYCARGKSNCEVPQKGCICAACPISREYKLEGGYYCINNKA